MNQKIAVYYPILIMLKVGSYIGDFRGLMLSFITSAKYYPHSTPSLLIQK